MHDVSKFTLKPSSLRLIDNYHVQLGLAFEHHENFLMELFDYIKKFTVQHVLRYDMAKVAMATYVLEGCDSDEIEMIEEKLRMTAKMHMGLMSGAKFGRKAYLMTYVICYTRVWSLLAVPITIIDSSSFFPRIFFWISAFSLTVWRLPFHGSNAGQ